MGPVVLLILDGWGYSAEQEGNAIACARSPNYDYLLNRFPHSLLQASGQFVGLPAGLMGNSEVGHLTIGAGRVVMQKLTVISKAIADGSFFRNKVLLEAVEKSKMPNAALHLIGLVSDGCVHSSPDHLDGLLALSRRSNVKELIVHPILDGRDTPPRSAMRFISELECKLKGLGRIGVICGRYYAMDRDNRWERTERYWRALVLAEANRAESAQTSVEEAYIRGQNDEFVTPYMVADRQIKDGDVVVCFNFRPDRVRQLSRVLTQPDFKDFLRPANPQIHYVCLTEYDPELGLPVAFQPSEIPSQEIDITLPEILSCHHIGQLHTAETEKYAHVTYFFNGGKEKPEAGENRILIPSLKVPTYDQTPAMQTAKVAEIACQALASGDYPFIILNFANPDMVGHTGDFDAAIEAVESVDAAFGKLIDSATAAKGVLIITADHGNCEQMIDHKTGQPHTAHTTNPVPFIVADFRASDKSTLSNGAKVVDGALSDIAPTILDLMGINQPKQMTGKSLLRT